MNRSWNPFIRSLLSLLLTVSTLFLALPSHAENLPLCSFVFSTEAASISPHLKKFIQTTREQDEEAAILAAFHLSNEKTLSDATFLKIAEILKNPKNFPVGREHLVSVLNRNTNPELLALSLPDLFAQNLKHNPTPELLLRLYHYAHSLRTVFGLELKSLEFKLKILDRMGQMPEGPMQIYMGSYGLNLDPRELQLLKAGLKATQEGSSQRRAKLRVLHQGRRFELELTDQQEYERRIELPALGFKVKTSLRSPYNYAEYTNERRVDQPEDVVRILLDKYGSLAEYNAPFRFRPLGSHHHHYHSGIYEAHIKTGAEPGKFTQTLQNLLSLNHKVGDNNSAEYIVVHQTEVATYYDSQNGDLKKQGYALRVKQWHPVGENADPNAPVAKAIFLKKTMPSEDSFFTNRQEIMVKLPENADADFIKAAMRALLIQEGVRMDEAVPLEAMVEVTNNRLGFDLVWKDEVKIGYMVIDSFSSRPLQGPPDAVYLPTNQWEVEILPQWRPLIELKKKEFLKFFAVIEEQFQGRLDVLPKYQHISPQAGVDKAAALLAKKQYKASARVFQTKSMEPGSRADDVEWGVEYLKTDTQRERYRIFVHKGRLYHSSGELVDTKGKSYMYVMDSQGHIYMQQRNGGVIKHSAFLGGEPAAAAGQIEVSEGLIQRIDNSSGHYLPTAFHFDQVLWRLRELGVSIEEKNIHLRPGT